MKGSFVRFFQKENLADSVEHQDHAVTSDPDDVELADHMQQIMLVPVELIDPNSYQPRKTFSNEALQELAQSIAEFGVIQPLIVCPKQQGRYELVAGERRLRAAKLAGLQQVPVILQHYTDREMAEIALIENLQREDLHFIEEAEGYQVLLNSFGLTQDELAKRIGKGQSTIANKLRILKLPAAVRQHFTEPLFTERHARALLRLPNEELQLQTIAEIMNKHLNVRQTEEYIETVLTAISREMEQKSRKKPRIVTIVKDVRIFLNTIGNVVHEMDKMGLKVDMEQVDEGDYITVKMRVPKRK